MDARNSLVGRSKLSPAQQAILEKRLGDATIAAALRIPRAPRDKPLPLSFSQQRLWFLDQLSPDNAFYNIPGVICLESSIDPHVLERALNEMVRRHESLRTTFPTVDGQPVQMVHPPAPVTLEVIDLTHLAEAEREAEARRIVAARTQQGFQLAVGPLLRTVLLKLNGRKWIFVLTVHHIVSDGWSIEVLWRELAAIYAAFVIGRPSPLPELPIQYADFAVWQRDWLSGAELERQLGYWREQLVELPTLSLPTDRPRPPMPSFRGETVPVSLGPALSAQVRELGRRTKCTPFMVLLAAFAALLSRYTGQDDLLIGTPVANRGRSELEGLIGFFVNTLVMRVDVSEDPTFEQVLTRVRDTALGAYAHQDLPFSKLVEEVHPERDLSRNPLFQVTFQLFSSQYASRKNSIAGLEEMLAELASYRTTAAFDLAINLLEVSGEFAGAIEYSADLFERSTIDRMVAHFSALLAGALATPSAHVSQLPLLTNQERQQLLVEWNSTAAEYPRDVTVQWLFEMQVRRTPDAVAVNWNGSSWNYAQLNQRADLLASALRMQTRGRKVRVGLCVRRSLGMIVGIIGILKAGCSYVPLDPSHPSRRHRFMLDETEAELVVLEAILEAEFSDQGQRRLLIASDGTVTGIDAAQDAMAQGTPAVPTAMADDVAYIMYTSGSTGAPKGVEILQRGLVNYLSWCTQAYAAGSGGAPVHSPISFDLTVTSIFAPLLAGQTLYLLPPDADPTALARLPNAHPFSLVKLTPSHLRVLEQDISPGQAAELTNLFVVGGENLSSADIEFWQRCAPDTVIFNEYGPTETVVGCCVYRVPPGLAESGSVPIGRPIANTRLYVLDRYLNPVPVGVSGELFIGGDGLARGYCNRPEETALRFVQSPFGAAGERLYRTGDLVRYRRDGNLEFLGRLDDQVKIRGHRIELGEIESTFNAHPDIARAIVVASRAPSGSQRLAAYLSRLAREGDDQSESTEFLAELRRYLQERLPAFMLPASIAVVNEWPLTANGKVDRDALSAFGASRVEPTRYVAPRTDLEQQLVDMWQKLLGVSAIGTSDNFFELGGHSLLAAQLVTRVREKIAADFALVTLFEKPTIAGMADEIEARRWAADATRVPLAERVTGDIEIESGTI